MNVTVFGSGYVGLVTAACLAHVGHQVSCVDIDTERVAGLNRGECPIYEPGLEDYLRLGLDEGRLSFTTQAGAAVRDADVIFIAVGTPTTEDGSADIRHVLTVARTIGHHLIRESLVVVKSTVPVGTADKVRNTIKEVMTCRDLRSSCEVASNPEFLKEGAAVNDFMRPDRIIVGVDSPHVVDVFRRLYSAFNRNHDRLMVMDVRSAELAKYAANAMLATKISFINEIANIAECVGADIESIRKGIGADERIGYHFIYPGCGYGGSCFPKDVRALAATAREHNYNPQMLPVVENINLQQKRKLFDKLQQQLGNLKGRTIAVWGLAFKPNTDDMREAPSRTLMEAVWAAGGKVRAYDPEAGDEALRIYPERDDLTVVESATDALHGADALAIVTEWQEFRSPDFELIKNSLSQPAVFDGRNIYDPRVMSELGFHYYSIGRGVARPAA